MANKMSQRKPRTQGTSTSLMSSYLAKSCLDDAKKRMVKVVHCSATMRLVRIVRLPLEALLNAYLKLVYM